MYSILNRPPSLSPARAHAVTAMLAVGLAGCAVELARSPQLVSFAPAAPELAAEATSSPVAAMPQGWDTVVPNPSQPRYPNVVFRAASARRGDAAQQPHMTLLKATVPGGTAASRWSDAGGGTSRKSARHAANRVGMIPASSGSEAQREAVAPQVQSFVVMTSWNAATSGNSWTMTRMTEQWSADGGSARPERARMIVTVARMPGQSSDGGSGQNQDQESSSVRAPSRNSAEIQRRDPAQPVFPQYAAVPTDLGWLIVEL